MFLNLDDDITTFYFLMSSKCVMGLILFFNELDLMSFL